MLFQLLDQVTNRISVIDVKTQTPVMLSQIIAARPDFTSHIEQDLKGKGVKREVIQLLHLAIASWILTLIKGIPEIVGLMVKEIKRKGTDPYTRCALAGVLAYCVQPHDLLPDDAPGGYGFVDDCVLLRAGLREYLNLLPANASDAEKQGNYIQMVSGILPVQMLPALQLAVQGMSFAFQALRLIPMHLVEMTTQQIIANPLQMTAQQYSPGFIPQVTTTLSQGHWSTAGFYVEGNNMIVPGGPSLIDGNIFIPD